MDRVDAEHAEWQKAFGARLAEARKRANLTQQAVADRLGFSRNAISSWECAVTEPDAKTLERLASLYGVDLIAIFPAKKLIIDESQLGSQLLPPGVTGPRVSSDGIYGAAAPTTDGGGGTILGQDREGMLLQTLERLSRSLEQFAVAQSDYAKADLERAKAEGDRAKADADRAAAEKVRAAQPSELIRQTGMLVEALASPRSQGSEGGDASEAATEGATGAASG